MNAVPVGDIGFVHAPAEIDFFAPVKRGEIEQADIEVLDDHARFFHFFERVFERVGVGIALRFPGFGNGGVDAHAALHEDALAQIVEVLFSLLIAAFGLDGFTDQAAHGGEQGTGFGEREVAWHFQVVGQRGSRRRITQAPVLRRTPNCSGNRRIYSEWS